ncbi:alpha/beta fold hydrolase [Hydrogenophaga crocea]|jgi:2-hydroxy-6-oxonona-2,4-dienedioate hydrolase|uniref:Alpha/beta fold hydrolase n=1 Tax=Hydrogenophaga crocea TaxID=2716225 RepID=A0A6G8IJK1_9BURK|nr:alpha/beta fold hydrolase [Hydrogenophaga crocea]QIM53195.1 alpha/beta fold hydrolase [Hydrogenophaga crocea]
MQSYGPLFYSTGLAVRSTGTGPALVLLHGGSGSRTHWARNVPELASSFQVITLDLPGFGESARPSQEMPVSDYLAWVAHAVRLAVGEREFHLVGFSFGGAVAAGVSALLASNGRAPTRLSLLSPAGFGPPAGRSIALEKVKGIDPADARVLREATARNLGRWMLAREPDPQDLAIDIHLRNVDLARFDSRQVSHQASLVDHVRTANVPTQVLLGQEDPLIFPSLQERIDLLRHALPSARVEVIEGAGHWLAYEASDTINQTIRQFHL